MSAAASASPSRAVEFLATFNDIEAFLREELGAKKTDSFKWMARQASQRGIITQDHAADLREFAELRNAISHGEYQDFRPIAEPLPETVQEIQRIRDALIQPALAVGVVGWVAAELETGNTIDSTTIATALELSGQHDTAVFLSQSATAAGAVEALTTPLDSGALLRLAIITPDGTDKQRPIAVVGATDIPALSAAS